MKNFKIYSVVLFVGLFITTSCDNGFDEVNTSDVRVNELDPVYLFNNAVVNCSPTVNSLTLEMAMMQQIVSPNGGVLSGGNFNQNNPSLVPGNWDAIYPNVINHLADVKNATINSSEHSNLYHMARIINCYAAMVATDSYGDVPYFEAGKGFLEGIVSPVYDPQKDIYTDILKELDEAGSGLSSSNKIEVGDALFNGDITKWKRFSYSLMLRAAMRVSNQESAMAQTYITKAVSGGLIQSNDDNVMIVHDFNFFNPIGENLNAQEGSNYYMTGEFVDYLYNNNDPRLNSIAVRYIGSTSGTDQNNAISGDDPSIVISTDPANQIGLPMGNDNGTANTLAGTLGLASFYDFTQVDRTRMTSIDAPVFLVTYAQTQLLLAEAVIRGYTTGDATILYSNGIEAHMQQLAEYGDDVAISQTDIDLYIAANPLGINNLEDINTQYWVASFLNGPEAWANFRRSGYPSLVPNPYPTQDISGDFINRFPYPDAELSANGANLNEALSRQGFSTNTLDGLVWWAR